MSSTQLEAPSSQQTDLKSLAQDIVRRAMNGGATAEPLGNDFLPSLMSDAIRPNPLARIVTSLNTFTCMLALAQL